MAASSVQREKDVVARVQREVMAEADGWRMLRSTYRTSVSSRGDGAGGDTTACRAINRHISD